MRIRAMETNPARTARILACLGDASRFRVMTQLVVRGGRCVTELAALVGLSQSCTTRHLQVLEREGLVQSLRSGKKLIFTASQSPRVAKLLEWAMLDSGTRESPATPPAPQRAQPPSPSPEAEAGTRRLRDNGIEDYLL
jgi:DNA-binding transcriptional ArsR family regulator